jgi:hypothetical protein
MCKLHQDKDESHQHDADCTQLEHQLVQLRSIQRAVLQLVHQLLLLLLLLLPLHAIMQLRYVVQLGWVWLCLLLWNVMPSAPTAAPVLELCCIKADKLDRPTAND